MRSTRRWIACILFLVTPVSVARAAEPRFTDGFWTNVQDSFTGPNLLLQAVGVGLTPVIIHSGLDAQVHDHFSHGRNYSLLPGVVIGSGIFAVGAAIPLYLSGKSSGDAETLGASFVIIQATAITLGYVTLLKAISGRPKPDNDSQLSSQEQSEVFQWGLLRGGVIAGWPSGHVSHTVAVTSALAHYYPDKEWLVWMGIAVSSYMLVTVSGFNAGQMHWFSDGVAGAFIGYAIGSSVGKNFRRLVNGEKSKDEETLTWFPMLSHGLVGGSVMLRF